MRFRCDFARWFSRAASLAVAVPLLAMTARSAGAQPPEALPPGLRPTEMNIGDPDHKYGESQIAVNPTNPDNLVSIWVKDSFTPCLRELG